MPMRVKTPVSSFWLATWNNITPKYSVYIHTYYIIYCGEMYTSIVL